MMTPILLLAAFLAIGFLLVTPNANLTETLFDANKSSSRASTIPNTVAALTDFEVAVQPTPSLADFQASVVNGDAETLVGVYVPGLFALPIVQQPADNAAFVSAEPGVITQFSLPNRYNVIGLLAHNYLSGENYFNLKLGQEVILVFGTGTLDYYRISAIRSFQAMNPTSPYSDFIDLDDENQNRLTSTQLFKQVYTSENQVVFQTCIKAFGDPSWGRLFVTAEKLDTAELIPAYLGSS